MSSVTKLCTGAIDPEIADPVRYFASTQEGGQYQVPANLAQATEPQMYA